MHKLVTKTAFLEGLSVPNSTVTPGQQTTHGDSRKLGDNRGIVCSMICCACPPSPLGGFSSPLSPRLPSFGPPRTPPGLLGPVALWLLAQLFGKDLAEQHPTAGTGSEMGGHVGVQRVSPERVPWVRMWRPWPLPYHTTSLGGCLQHVSRSHPSNLSPSLPTRASVPTAPSWERLCFLWVTVQTPAGVLGLCGPPGGAIRQHLSRACPRGSAPWEKSQ